MYLKMFISFIKQSSATLPLNKALAEFKKKNTTNHSKIKVRAVLQLRTTRLSLVIIKH